MRAKVDLEKLLDELHNHGFAKRNFYDGIVKMFRNQDGKWLSTARVKKTHGNQYISWYLFSHWWPDKTKQPQTDGIHTRIGIKRK